MENNAPSILWQLVKHAIPAIFFCALMWIGFFMQIVLVPEIDITQFGLVPRTIKGLVSIMVYPFLHGNFDHLLSNTGPILILGTLLLMFYRPIWFRVFTMLFFLSGLGLWLGGRPDMHIGASGVVYALASFLITIGLLRKTLRPVAVALLVIFLYGGLVWGIMPVLVHVSWEGHLFGLVAGVITAFYFRHEGTEKHKLYNWEIEEIEEMIN